MLLGTLALALTLSLSSSKSVPSPSSSSPSSTFTVFIDGEAGTTGLQVRDRLQGRTDLTVLTPPPELRKDPATRRKFLNEADACILCLPDAASKEAAAWLEEDKNTKTVLIDASTAFRTDPAFAYGLPELSEAQRSKIKQSKRISNPGCYPTGFICLVAPLVSAGLLSKDSELSVNAISGYSGGGKPLMALYQNPSGKPEDACEPYGAYGFNLAHKHMPEMALYTGLNKQPVFQPSVGNFPQGMLVNVPLHYSQLREGATGEDVQKCLEERYRGSTFVKVLKANSVDHLERGAFLRPDTLKNTNRVELLVNYNDANRMCVVTARLDNLGKGASGAAVQNLNLALGIQEDTGLA